MKTVSVRQRDSEDRAMPRRKLTQQEKHYAIDAKRAQMRKGGKAEIIPDLTVDDETDERGQPVVREKTTRLAP